MRWCVVSVLFLVGQLVLLSDIGVLSAPDASMGGGWGQGNIKVQRQDWGRETVEPDPPPPQLHIEETVVVVHETPVGQLVLAGVLGTSVGLLCGFLLTLLGGCCVVKCCRGTNLAYDSQNNTYRSADVIDGEV